MSLMGLWLAALFCWFQADHCDLETQDLEDECLKPEPSHKLLEIGLCLLKWISSHRGLTYVEWCSP